MCYICRKIFPANEGWTWRVQASSVCGFGFVPNAYLDPCRGLLFVLFTTPPPDRSAQEFRDLDEYLIDSTDCLRNKYPDCGIVILGDFNNFDLHNRTSNHSLKQVVHLPTRGSAILDLIATNLHNLYEKPYILAPLSTSDHNIVHWLPLTKDAINTLDLLQVSLSLSYSIGPL